MTCCVFFFFFKQKTAYEMRISDWSSDVCSSDLGYASFDDFLGTLNSQKRKQLRKERLRAVEGLRIEELTGDAIGPEHWDAMWLFYQDTGARKWGHPYLTREAFDQTGRAHV